MAKTTVCNVERGLQRLRRKSSSLTLPPRPELMGFLPHRRRAIFVFVFVCVFVCAFVCVFACIFVFVFVSSRLTTAPRADELSLLTGGQGKAGKTFSREWAQLFSSCSCSQGGIGNPRQKHLSRNFFFDLVQLSSHIASEWVRVMTRRSR